MAANEQIENNSKQIEPLVINNKLTAIQADLLGVMAFSFALNKSMAESRAKGEGEWHKSTLTPQIAKTIAKELISENKIVEAGAMLMIAWNLERMKDEN